MAVERTPSQWFDALNSRFTTTSRAMWTDRRERPGMLNGDVQRSWATFSRSTTPRNQWLDTLWSYYIGDPPLPQVSSEYKELFRDVLRKARSNYAPLCVNAMLDRMELQAVSTLSDQDTDGDDVAASIMDESGFAAVFKDMLGYLFAMGESYAMVVPGVPYPTVHAIDPRRCVGIPDKRNPVRLAAAVVREVDEVTNEEVAYLFLPGKKWEYRAAPRTSTFALQKFSDESEFESITDVPAELGGIPIVRFDNPHGLGEYEPHVDLLDRINDTTLQRIVGFWYQALRTRAVGVDEDEDLDDQDYGDDPDGDALVPDRSKGIDWDKVKYDAGPGAFLKFPRDFQIWESQQTDFGPLITGKREDVKEFAGASSTPLYLITPDDANGSALGAGLQREAATSKIRDRRARMQPRLKLLWRIVFAMADQKDRGRELRLHWGPIEFRTLAEQASADAQAESLSTEDKLERIWQMSPDEIKRTMQRRAAERLLEQSMQPPTTPPGGQAAPQQQLPRSVNEPDDSPGSAA